MFKHYTMCEVVLPPGLERKLSKDDIAFTVNDLVESIPDEAYDVKHQSFTVSNSTISSE